jgi:nicotinate-nucleotide adenylyltransferase
MFGTVDQGRSGAAGRRIGVFGGTFDPPHIGHLVTAIDARDALSLDVVLFVVANEPWQKTGSRVITPAGDRLKMVRAAVRGERALEASDLEIVRGGPSYTVETLEALLAAETDAQLHLLLGSDAAAGLFTWHRAAELPELCRLVVVERPGRTTELPDGLDAIHLAVPRLEVSSTDLRDRAADGRSLRHMVPEDVISLIREGDLYGDRR